MMLKIVEKKPASDCPPVLPVQIHPDMKLAVNGTFEAVHKNGRLHLGVTYPSSGTRPERVAVPQELIEALGIRPGDQISGGATRRRSGAAELRSVRTINGMPAEDARRRPDFYSMTPVYPTEQLRLRVEGAPCCPAMTAIDQLAPIGKGSRVLITAPAQAGKTRLLGEIAASMQINNPEVHMFVLMIGGWPEEVPGMRRLVRRGEVIFSDGIELPRNHVRAAVATIERAKRLAEMQRDAVILIDGIAMLADACDSVGPGRGIGCAAWVNVMSLFGAARNLEGGGSVTIVAACSERGGDDVACVMTEASNAAIHLKPGAANPPGCPVVDPNRSFARRSELLRKEALPAGRCG